MAGIGAHGTDVDAHGGSMDRTVSNASTNERHGSCVAPVDTIELAVSLTNLTDRDILSTSDPMCVLFTREMRDRPWVEYGRTEKIKNSLNPSFVRKFEIDYVLEGRQYLRFDIYDIDHKTPRLERQDPLGTVEATLGNIVRGSPFTRPLQSLRGKSARGEITIVAEKRGENKGDIMMHWSGKDLPRKDLFSSDPMLEFLRKNSDDSFTPVYRTQHVSHCLNPQWPSFRLTMQQLCNSNISRTIKIICWDWNQNGRHTFMGEITTTLQALLQDSRTCKEYWLINPEKKEKNVGKLILHDIASRKNVTLTDFIKSGREFRISVALDFSLSNKHPSNPDSLHYNQGDGLSTYGQALVASVGILEEQLNNSERYMSAFGYGAREPPSQAVLDIFALDTESEDPQCQGTAGLMAAYDNCLRSIEAGTLELHGPTNLAPILNRIAMGAKKRQREGHIYSIALILTDGELSDMEAIKEILVKASEWPMSVIIIGIGDDDENFEALRELDEGPIISNGQEAKRNILQFVQYAQTDGDSSRENRRIRLAREVVREIPTQISTFFALTDNSCNHVSRESFGRVTSTIV